MKPRLGFLLGAMAIALSGCATPYHRYNGTSGYSETPLERDVYEVSFIGLPQHNGTQVRHWATLRAAEMSLERGARFFEILDSRSEVKVTTRMVAAQTTIERKADAQKESEKDKSTSKEAETEQVVVRSVPAHEVREERHVVKLAVRLLGEPTARSFDAVALLMEGRRQGIKFSRQAEAALPPR